MQQTELPQTELPQTELIPNLDTDGVSHVLKCTTRHVYNLMNDPSTNFPKGFKVGRLRRWTPGSIAAWIKEQDCNNN